MDLLFLWRRRRRRARLSVRSVRRTTLWDIATSWRVAGQWRVRKSSRTDAQRGDNRKQDSENWHGVHVRHGSDRPHINACTVLAHSYGPPPPQQPSRPATPHAQSATTVRVRVQSRSQPPPGVRTHGDAPWPGNPQFSRDLRFGVAGREQCEHLRTPERDRLPVLKVLDHASVSQPCMYLSYAYPLRSRMSTAACLPQVS